MRILYIVTIILISFLLACEPDRTYELCDITSDCSDSRYACLNGRCELDECRAYDDIDCGKGKCVPGSKDGKSFTGHYCECEENAVIIPERAICVPTCDGYSEECTEFGKTTDFDSCNMEKGHCDRKCQGEGSCKPGYYCSNGGACRRGPCVEGGCQDGFTCQDGLCEID